MKHPYPSILLVCLAIFGLSAPVTAHAQAQPGAIPEFVPSSPWVVGETGLSEVRGVSGLKLPCMMVNQFDNGFIMRLAGGGNNLSAMAIDFRQPIFAKGRRYGAALYTDTGFHATVQGTAFNDATLIFNLRDAGDVYSALKAGRILGLSIGNNDMRFSLSNITQGLDNLEGCFSGAVPAPSVQQATQQATNQASQGADDMSAMPSFDQQPTSLADIQSQSAAHSAGNEVYIKRGEKLPRGVTSHMGASPAQMATQSGTWQAQAGENIQTVLSRWADVAGVELNWNASGDGQVAQDFAHNGNFNDAVTALLSENAAASGLRSNFDDGAGARANAPTYVSHAPTPLTPAPPRAVSAPNGQFATGGRWMAPKGGSLQAVLEQWASKAGVELLWYANSGYIIKDNINQGGAFETALQSLLESYASDNNRPAARLNTDPGTGRKVLVVESDRTL